MKKMIVMAAVIGLTAVFSQAAYLYNWDTSTDPTIATISDAAADNDWGDAGADILSVKCVQADSGYYFLMTLQAAPTPGAYAGTYSINIDKVAGGGDSLSVGGANRSRFVAGTLTGIDLILDKHYNAEANGGLGAWDSADEHVFVGGAPTVQPKFNTTETPANGIQFNLASGTELEWYVPYALIGRGETTFAGSSLNSEAGGSTADFTGVSQVPEPTGMALLALGLAAVGLRRKLRK